MGADLWGQIYGGRSMVADLRRRIYGGSPLEAAIWRQPYGKGTAEYKRVKNSITEYTLFGLVVLAELSWLN